MATMAQVKFLEKCPHIRAELAAIEKLTNEYEREFDSPNRRDRVLDEILKDVGSRLAKLDSYDNA